MGYDISRSLVEVPLTLGNIFFFTDREWVYDDIDGSMSMKQIAIKIKARRMLGDIRHVWKLITREYMRAYRKNPKDPPFKWKKVTSSTMKRNEVDLHKMITKLP